MPGPTTIPSCPAKTTADAEIRRAHGVIVGALANASKDQDGSPLTAKECKDIGNAVACIIANHGWEILVGDNPLQGLPALRKSLENMPGTPEAKAARAQALDALVAAIKVAYPAEATAKPPLEAVAVPLWGYYQLASVEVRLNTLEDHCKKSREALKALVSAGEEGGSVDIQKLQDTTKEIDDIQQTIEATRKDVETQKKSLEGQLEALRNEVIKAEAKTKVVEEAASDPVVDLNKRVEELEKRLAEADATRQQVIPGELPAQAAVPTQAKEAKGGGSKLKLKAGGWVRMQNQQVGDNFGTGFKPLELNLDPRVTPYMDGRPDGSLGFDLAGTVDHNPAHNDSCAMRVDDGEGNGPCEDAGKPYGFLHLQAEAWNWGANAYSLDPPLMVLEGGIVAGPFKLTAGFMREAIRFGDWHLAEGAEVFAQPRSIAGGPGVVAEVEYLNNPHHELRSRFFVGTHPAGDGDQAINDAAMGTSIIYKTAGLTNQQLADVTGVKLAELKDAPTPPVKPDIKDPVRLHNESEEAYAKRLAPVVAKREEARKAYEAALEPYKKALAEYGAKKADSQKYGVEIWADARYYTPNRELDPGTVLGRAGFRGPDGKLVHVSAGANLEYQGYKLRLIGAYGLGLDKLDESVHEDLPYMQPYVTRSANLSLETPALLGEYGPRFHLTAAYTDTISGSAHDAGEEVGQKPSTDDDGNLVLDEAGNPVFTGYRYPAAFQLYNAGYQASTLGLLVAGKVPGVGNLQWKLHGLAQSRLDKAGSYKLEGEAERDYVPDRPASRSYLYTVRAGLQYMFPNNFWLAGYGGFASYNQEAVGKGHLGPSTAALEGKTLVPVFNTGVGYFF